MGAFYWGTVRRFGTTSLVTGLLSVSASAQQVSAEFKDSYRYDVMGRVTGVISPDPDGSGPLHFSATRNTYDNRGQLVLVEDGSLSGYQTDSIDPQLWVGFTVYRTKTYEYDDLGRQVIAATADFQLNQESLVQKSFDVEHRVKCSTVRMNPSQYASLPTDACSLGTEGGDGPDRVTRYTYSASGFGSVTLEERAVGTSLEQNYKQYEYDSSRRVIGLTDANGNYTRIEYDSKNRVYRTYFPSKTVAGAHNTTDYEQYTYDDNGNQLTLRKRDGQTIVFEYDDLGRLTKKDVPLSNTQDVYFAYDNRGLRKYARFTSNVGQGVSYSYDGFGHIASSTIDLDATSRTISYLSLIHI